MASNFGYNSIKTIVDQNEIDEHFLCKPMQCTLCRVLVFTCVRIFVSFFKGSVCRSVLENPYAIDVCNHVYDQSFFKHYKNRRCIFFFSSCNQRFCQTCLYNSFAQTKKCPLCRREFNHKKIQFANEIDQKLKTLKYICNGCDSKVTRL